MEQQSTDNGNGSSNPPKKKKSALPKLELLIIGIFFLCFLMWAASRCSNTRAKYEQMALEAKKQDSILKALQTEIPEPIKAMEQTENIETSPVFEDRYTPLYVTVENLNMRDKPSRKGKILARLKLFDELIFMDEVTDFKEEITLGDLTSYEPWIRVQTIEGETSGWVYGAYVQYYKTKLQTEKTESTEQ